MKTSRSKNDQKKKLIIFRKYMQRKLAFVFVVITLALFALGIVLLTINKDDGEEYQRIVLSQQSFDSRTLVYERGEIWDRNGTPIAMNEKVYNLILDPGIILTERESTTLGTVQDYKEPTLTALVEVFGYSREELEQVLAEKPDSHYVRYERQLSEEQKQAFDDYVAAFEEQEHENSRAAIKGVWFEEEYKRVYPYDTLASKIIGFASSDGTQGSWGLEQYYNDELTGTNGRIYGYLNDDSNSETVTEPAVNGHTLVGTIDIAAQKILQDHIEAFQEQVDSVNIAALVMNPQNGEILAMTSNQEYDLNNPADLTPFYSQEEIDAMSEDERVDALSQIWRNYCISDAFEPGSTAKPFTVAAGLEEGKLTGNETFYCGGWRMVDGFQIKCHNRTGGHQTLDVTHSLMSSCNVALMDMALDYIGKDIFYDYQKRFNFGQTTGIDLPGEAAGILQDESNITDSALATNSFGQNFTSTMVQIASAYCSLINGGNYYRPHMVKQILDEDGTVVKTFDAEVVRQTVSNDTSEFLKNALYMTMTEGTANQARVEGYEMGGKTGTAQKLPRDAGRYIISLISHAPADNPELMLYVVIDDPQVEEELQGDSVFVKDLTREIMADLMPYFNIYPTEVVETQPEETQPETDENGNPVETQPETDENGNPVETQPETDENGNPVETQPETDENGNPVETQPETDENGNPVETQPETDAEGNPVQPSDSPINIINSDDSYDEAPLPGDMPVPEGMDQESSQADETSAQ